MTSSTPCSRARLSTERHPLQQLDGNHRGTPVFPFTRIGTDQLTRSDLGRELASASLYIYLTGYQIYPHLEHHPWLALAAGLGVDVLYWKVTDHVLRRFRRRTRSRPAPHPRPGGHPPAGTPPAAAPHRGDDRGGRGTGE